MGRLINLLEVAMIKMVKKMMLVLVNPENVAKSAGEKNKLIISNTVKAMALLNVNRVAVRALVLMIKPKVLSLVVRNNGWNKVLK
jgi:hypothetical protein